MFYWYFQLLCKMLKLFYLIFRLYCIRVISSVVFVAFPLKSCLDLSYVKCTYNVVRH